MAVERQLDLEQQRACARELCQATLTGMAKIPPFKDAHAIHLDGVVSPATAELLNSSPDDATRWMILLASPEFQLK